MQKIFTRTPLRSKKLKRWLYSPNIYKLGEVCAQPSWRRSFWSRTPAPRSKSYPLAPLPLPPPLPLPLYRPLPLLHPPQLSIPLPVHLCIKQCCGSLTFRYGSGSGDPYHWLTDTEPTFFVSGWHDDKKVFFSKFFCLLLFENTFTSVFKNNK